MSQTVVTHPEFEEFRGCDPDTIEAIIEGLKEAAVKVYQPNMMTARGVAEKLIGRFDQETIRKFMDYCDQENGPNQQSLQALIILLLPLPDWLRRG